MIGFFRTSPHQKIAISAKMVIRPDATIRRRDQKQPARGVNTILSPYMFISCTRPSEWTCPLEAQQRRSRTRLDLPNRV